MLSALGARGAGPDAVFVPTLRRATEDRREVLRAVGTLCLRGARIDWEAFHRGESVCRVPLPTTPWLGESYWFREVGMAAAASPGHAAATRPTDAPIPGVRGRIRGAVPAYELDLASEHWSGLSRTDQGGGRFLAFGALAETTFAVAQDCCGGRFDCVEEASFHAPLLVGPDRTVQITVSEVDDGHVLWEIRSTSPIEQSAGAPWRLHANGVLRRRVGCDRLADREHPPSLRVDGYILPLRFEPGSLSAALADALEQVKHDEDGVLVALTGPGGWVEVLDATVAAVSWAARPPGPEHVAAAGRLRRVGGLACAEPSSVRYVRATGQVRRVRRGPGRRRLLRRGRRPPRRAAREVLVGPAPFAVAARGRGGATRPRRCFYDAVWEPLEPPGEPGRDRAGSGGRRGVSLLVADRSGVRRLRLAARAAGARGAEVVVGRAPIAADEKDGPHVDRPALRILLDVPGAGGCAGPSASSC